MSADLIDALLADGRRLGVETERARQTMLRAAEMRQEAMFGLHAEGLSIRDIALQLGCSAKVVQDGIDKARRRRPALERREERVSWELHHAIADHLEADPEPVLAIARRNLARMKAQKRDEHARGWVEEWERLVDGDVSALIERMLGTDERARDLRQMTPFAGAITQGERVLAIHKAAPRAS